MDRDVHFLGANDLHHLTFVYEYVGGVKYMGPGRHRSHLSFVSVLFYLLHHRPKHPTNEPISISKVFGRFWNIEDSSVFTADTFGNWTIFRVDCYKSQNRLTAEIVITEMRTADAVLSFFFQTLHYFSHGFISFPKRHTEVDFLSKRKLLTCRLRW